MTTVDGGTVSSLRWIDVLAGGVLDGHGSIDAIVYNGGTVAPIGGEQPVLSIDGDYRQADQGVLRLTTTRNSIARLEVSRGAFVAGKLAIAVTEGFAPRAGASFPVVVADHVEGRFDNAKDEVVASDGSRFTIRYTATEVTLTRR